MSRNHANPTNWDDYQYGTSSSHRGSVSSTGGRSVSFADSTRDHSPSDRGDEYRRESQDETDGPNLRRRRYVFFYSYPAFTAVMEHSS
jgi:vesicular inhibitory amino acid transporter